MSGAVTVLLGRLVRCLYEHEAVQTYCKSVIFVSEIFVLCFICKLCVRKCFTFTKIGYKKLVVEI